MIPKNRIHLCRSLHSQTTPYPNAGRWIKRGIITLILVLLLGIYGFTRPRRQSGTPSPQKQILGEQQQETPVQYQTYEVKKGDTLFNLSQKYNISWQTLAEINGLQQPFVLKIGQQLKLPQ